MQSVYTVRNQFPAWHRRQAGIRTQNDKPADTSSKYFRRAPLIHSSRITQHVRCEKHEVFQDNDRKAYSDERPLADYSKSTPISVLAYLTAQPTCVPQVVTQLLSASAHLFLISNHHDYRHPQQRKVVRL